MEGERRDGLKGGEIDGHARGTRSFAPVMIDLLVKNALGEVTGVTLAQSGEGRRQSEAVSSGTCRSVSRLENYRP